MLENINTNKTENWTKGSSIRNEGAPAGIDLSDFPATTYIGYAIDTTRTSYYITVNV
jgi:hypothetical protein